MIAYKGFTKDLTATMGQGVYQFKIGETVEESHAKCASKGFHCAEDPLDVLRYYSASSSRYCIVRAEGDIHEDAVDSRISCTKITLVKEISRQQLAAHACNFMYKHPMRKPNERVKKEWGSAEDCFVIVRGKNPVAKGKKETILFLLLEEEHSCEIVKITALEVDGKQYKQNVYYDTEGKEAGHEESGSEEVKNA